VDAGGRGPGGGSGGGWQGDALAAGCIPIYMGSSNAQHIVPDPYRFIVSECGWWVSVGGWACVFWWWGWGLSGVVREGRALGGGGVKRGAFGRSRDGVRERACSAVPITP
jgi:hypothetical protein